jgi:hypothetical protein
MELLERLARRLRPVSEDQRGPPPSDLSLFGLVLHDCAAGLQMDRGNGTHLAGESTYRSIEVCTLSKMAILAWHGRIEAEDRGGKQPCTTNISTNVSRINLQYIAAQENPLQLSTSKAMSNKLDLEVEDINPNEDEEKNTYHEARCFLISQSSAKMAHLIPYHTTDLPALSQLPVYLSQLDWGTLTCAWNLCWLGCSLGWRAGWLAWLLRR